LELRADQAFSTFPPYTDESNIQCFDSYGWPNDDFLIVRHSVLLLCCSKVEVHRRGGVISARTRSAPASLSNDDNTLEAKVLPAAAVHKKNAFDQ